jgi:hypothetical protein
MNDESIQRESTADAPWTAYEHEVRVPNTSLLPGSEKAPPPAVKLLRKAVSRAHSSLDRLAVGATPAVQQLGEKVSDLGSKVRSNPLVSVAAAVALGALIARMTRRRI